MFFKVYRNKHIFFDFNVLKVNSFTQFIGLMFSSSKTSIRLFYYNCDKLVDIHSWFVFYSFFIVWLDKKNRIIDYKLVKPFTFCVKAPRKFRSFLEIPFDEKYKKEVRFIVGKAKI